MLASLRVGPGGSGPGFAALDRLAQRRSPLGVPSAIS